MSDPTPEIVTADPSVRDAKEALSDARALLKRGRRLLSETQVATVESALGQLQNAIDTRRNVPGVPAATVTLGQAVASVQAVCELHLAPYRKSKVREYAESISLAILLALIVRAFAFEAFQIPTGSMEPTLLVGDHLFVAKSAFGIRVPFTNRYLARWAEVERGDVIVFSFPVEEVRTQTQIGVLTRHIIQSQRAGGSFPASLDAATDPATGQPPAADLHIDAWGTPFRYTSDGATFALASAGPDGAFDTGDDLTHQNSAFYNGLDRCLDEDSVLYGKDYIKRVIGLPGDRISLRDNVVYVNDVAIERSEPFANGIDEGMPYTDSTDTLDNGLSFTTRSFGVRTNFGEIVVRPGHVFAMGDNRDRSSDGRCWGQVPIENIKGTAMFIFFSRDRLGTGRVRWERLFERVH